MISRTPQHIVRGLLHMVSFDPFFVLGNSMAGNKPFNANGRLSPANLLVAERKLLPRSKQTFIVGRFNSSGETLGRCSRSVWWQTFLPAHAKSLSTLKWRVLEAVVVLSIYAKESLERRGTTRLASSWFLSGEIRQKCGEHRITYADIVSMPLIRWMILPVAMNCLAERRFCRGHTSGRTGARLRSRQTKAEEHR